MVRDNGGIKSGERPADAPPFRDLLSAALDATDTGQSELARKIGRTEAAVSQWLRKGDMPGLDVVFKIEDALNLRFGTMVRHVSPEVWAIIEVKTSRPVEVDPEKMYQEALFELPLNNKQRRIL
ncbi:MAG TPA: helix-turn-helix transcriptional regulator, partial [Pseudonocardiaceae bacterium]|nr:helix-turn-helix transcriptional regulator [Pseudonocardiaceae bacterium]